MRFSAWKHLPLACTLLALAACEDPSGSGTRPLARVVVVSGDLQAATAGTELSDPLVVRAEDAGGRPVAGQALTFVVAAGNGQVSLASVQTDREGIARNRWTLGTAVGDTQRVEVRATDPAAGAPQAFAELRALARAGAAASLEIYGGNNQTGVVGSPLADSLAVIVRDQHGNPVPGAGVSWGSGGPILPNPATTDAQGVARVRWTLSSQPGPVTAIATAANASVTLIANAVPGPAVSITVTPTVIEGTVNSIVLVQAFPRDAFGNPTADPIDFTIGNSDVAFIHQTLPGLRHQIYLQALGETTFTARVRGTSTQAVVPVRVVPVSFARVSAGGRQSCGLSTTGVAYCWGGDRPLENAGYPTPTIDLDVDQMRCGLSLLPISGRGVARCSAFLDEVSGDFAFTTVGYNNVCAWNPSGGAWCWGLDNGLGQLGNGSRVATRAATPVAGGRPYTGLSAGYQHVCALSGDAAYCWGSNEHGGLGTGSGSGPQVCDGRPCSTVPVAVTGGIAFRSVTAGGSHSCGLDAGGAAWCWGYNGSGQLGDGTRDPRHAPVRVVGGLAFTQLSAGYAFTCGITTGGATYCWGDNFAGQLGNGTEGGFSTTPARVTGGVTFTQIESGQMHACAVDTSNRAWCWGSNSFRQLGIGSGPPTGTPQRVRG